MRVACVLLAVSLIILAIPALARADSAIRDGSGRQAFWQSARAILAIAAASALLVMSLRA